MTAFLKMSLLTDSFCYCCGAGLEVSRFLAHANGKANLFGRERGRFGRLPMPAPVLHKQSHVFNHGTLSESRTTFSGKLNEVIALFGYFVFAIWFCQNLQALDDVQWNKLKPIHKPTLTNV